MDRQILKKKKKGASRLATSISPGTSFPGDTQAAVLAPARPAPPGGNLSSVPPPQGPRVPQPVERTENGGAGRDRGL